MKKNSQLHITLSSELLDLLRKEAENKNIVLAELCRQKLRENFKLEKIENLLEKILDEKFNRT